MISINHINTMDTIIDTRQFPKEMEEMPKMPNLKEKKSSSSFLMWLIFFLFILFGGYYLYTTYYYYRGEEPIVLNVEKQNEFIQKVVESKKPLPSPTYERGVTHLFGE